MEQIYFSLRAFADPIAMALLLLVMALWKLRRVRRERPYGIWWWSGVCGTALLYVMSVSPVVSILAFILENDYHQPDIEGLPRLDAIVVLGAGITENGLAKRPVPSYETASRLLYSLQVMRYTEAPHLVLSGSTLGACSLSEAEVMADIAKKLGVPESKIIVDSSSNNTWEHAIALRNIIKDSNLSIGIVTSAVHMKRSCRTFGKYFTRITPLPSGYLYVPLKVAPSAFLPGTRRFVSSEMILHEILGLAWYRIRGYVAELSN